MVICLIQCAHVLSSLSLLHSALRGITALRAAPAHALIFAMYEKTMDLFRKFDPQVEDSIDKRSGSISHSS